MMDVDLKFQPINMLVVGECGDGKSTLINALRNPAMSSEPLCGKNPQGVTKDIVLYRCFDLDGGIQFNLIDTPGVGDGTVTPVALIAMLEEFLSAGTVPGGIRGVIVTTPIPDCRIKLGAQVVQIIVDKGFVATTGEDKYANILLTGTKADRAEEDERQNFMDGLNGERSVRQIFFEKAKDPSKGVAVMVNKSDYSALLKAIKELPAVSIAYKVPEAKVMATALAEKMGMEADAFEEQMTVMRDLVSQQSGQIKELMQKMFEAEEKHREEMKQRDEKMFQLQEQMREDQKRADEQRRQQQAQFEQLRKEEQDMRRQEQQLQQQRWEEEKERSEQMLRDMKAQAASDKKAHEESMKKMQEANKQAFEQAKTAADAAKTAAENSGGGGCFPGSAVVETPQGPLHMRDVRAGDRVLAVDAGGQFFFDEVYFFGHAQAHAWEPYTWIRTVSGKVLRASPKHQVPVAVQVGRATWRGAAFRQAASVRPGERLWVRGAKNRAELEPVLEVSTCYDRGLFNPFTFSGTVVADGVVASVHSDWIFDDLVPARWLHRVNQAVLLPGRVAYRLMGPAAADALEVNNPQGAWNATVGTSPRAFAFFTCSYLVPAMVLALAFAQRMTFE